jgi:hypothetical protein
MPDGTHTANATITDPKGPKNANVANCGANFNVNVPHNPPQVTCSANPTSVKPGESSTITASATSPDKGVEISSYAYSASAGTVSGTGHTATLNTTPDTGGRTINVTVTATDSRGLTGSCTTSVAVAAPPISCVNIEDWGDCTFEKDPRRPWRVDNDCKDTLDKLALRLQQAPNGKLAVVGYTDEKEVVSGTDSGLATGGQRQVLPDHRWTYQDRSQPHQTAAGGTKGKATHFYFVADGTLCSGQVVRVRRWTRALCKVGRGVRQGTRRRRKRLLRRSGPDARVQRAWCTALEGKFSGRTYLLVAPRLPVPGFL